MLTSSTTPPPGGIGRRRRQRRQWRRWSKDQALHGADSEVRPTERRRRARPPRVNRGKSWFAKEFRDRIAPAQGRKPWEARHAWRIGAARAVGPEALSLVGKGARNTWQRALAVGRSPDACRKIPLARGRQQENGANRVRRGRQACAGRGGGPAAQVHPCQPNPDRPGLRPRSQA